MKKMKHCIAFVFCFLSIIKINAQEVDLENIGGNIKENLKKNPFKISGGVSANAIFYSSNVNQNREPFTYFLNGNLNLGLYNWSMPISYSLTNQGSNLGYQVPFKFNRISVSPKYKWVRAHIGDSNMNFSSYTYNGLLFTGLGLELTPDIPFKIALLGGRLNKAVEDDGQQQTIASYKRMGYGAHLKWEKERYKMGLIGFYAKDDLNSLKQSIDDRGITPEENLVLSMLGSFKLLENVEVFAEFSNSGLISDIRAEKGKSSKGIANKFLKNNSSSESFNAYNAGVNFNLKSTSLGIKYERIDPGYRTLGAYYFNNDLENITINTAFNLFKGNVNVSANIGRQRDNLNSAKLKQTNRWVGSINTNVKATDKLMFTATYSNFTMYTNNQLNQFNNLNNNPLALQQPRDSINYKQISQNFNLNANYNLSSRKELTQNINFNYSLNDMVNKENNIVRRGGLNRFHNANLTYSIGLPERSISLATSINYTNMYAASKTTNIWGPSATINKMFMDKKLQTSFGVSYNASTSNAISTKVSNFRLNAGYSPWEKHNFSATIIQLFRNTNQDIPDKKLNELTATLGYNYSF
ncbi:hypothetical protein [Chishuiella sp.]|uniref:hypothetical protein n=1 Tax=Chishuiella sp. TaxID=1969467 RepID=UPI0028AAD162|nr:hypothetical protein [Chishuiella sp.]